MNKSVQVIERVLRFLEQEDFPLTQESRTLLQIWMRHPGHDEKRRARIQALLNPAETVH